jgi:Predicted membrane protein
MSDARRPLAEHRRRLGLLADEVLQLRRALPRRDRLLAGLLHALRTVLAASLGYSAARWLGLEQGFWAAIAAISVTQSSYAEARHASRDQLLGAMIGGLVGLAAATLGHEQFFAYALALGVGMMLCWVCDLGVAGRMSGITTTIMLLVPHTGTFWQFALFRLGEVALGAVAALLVTRAFDVLEQRLFAHPPSP